MTSPNEPGAPKKGDGPDGDGSVERAGARHGAPPAPGGRAQEGGDGPPWQRSGAWPQDFQAGAESVAIRIWLPDGSRKPASMPYGCWVGSCENSTPRLTSSS